MTHLAGTFYPEQDLSVLGIAAIIVGAFLVIRNARSARWL